VHALAGQQQVEAVSGSIVSADHSARLDRATASRLLTSSISTIWAAVVKAASTADLSPPRTGTTDYPALRPTIAAPARRAPHQRRDCLGFSTRRLRHLQFQPHPGRHRGEARMVLLTNK
jgi:hypothetical protein